VWKITLNKIQYPAFKFNCVENKSFDFSLLLYTVIKKTLISFMAGIHTVSRIFKMFSAPNKEYNTYH